MLKRSATTTGCQNYSIVVDTHVFGVHNLVSGCIFEHAVLVNTTAVSKCIATHNSFVGLHRHVHQAAHHAAKRIDLGGVDVCIDSEIRVALKCHYHLFERCVAGTFANTIDGNFHLTGTINHTGYGVGGGHTQIVVAVCAQYGFSGA